MKLVIDQTYEADASPWGVPAVIYRMVVDDTTVGQVRFRIADTPEVVLYSGHVSYDVEPADRGRGYAVEACRLVGEIARGRGMRVLWITCDPANAASIRVLEKAGAVHIETVELPEASRYYQRGERLKRRYRLELS